MNEQKRNFSVLLSYLFCCLTGVLFHFLYGWSSEWMVLRPFVPVNESVFEHLKLLFYPMLLATVSEAFLTGRSPMMLLASRAVSAWISCALLTGFFYSYSALAGHTILFVDIASYFVFVALAYRLSEAFCARCGKSPAFVAIGCFLLIAACALFALFSEFHPELPFFQDPSSSL